MRRNKSKPKQPLEQFVESIDKCIWRKHNARHSMMCSIDSDECVYALKPRDKSTCCIHGESSCVCPRKLFQATTNSKRSLHLYTFWEKLLGGEFPITDNMVKNVASVITHRDPYGQKDGGCCINGGHYVWSSDRALEVVIIDGLRCLQPELPSLQALLDDKTMTLSERISCLSREFCLSKVATPEQLKKEPICRNRSPKAKPEKRSAQDVTPCRRSRTRPQDEDSDDQDYSPSGRTRVGHTEAYASSHQLRVSVRSLSPRLASEDSPRKKTKISDSPRLPHGTITAKDETNPLSQYQPLSTPSQSAQSSQSSQSSQSTHISARSEMTRRSSELISSEAGDFNFPVDNSISIEAALSRELSFAHFEQPSVPISTEATNTPDFARNVSASFLSIDWPNTDDQFDWALGSMPGFLDGDQNFELFTAPQLNFS